MIAGSAATGAGVGGALKRKKGALIGAAIGRIGEQLPSRETSVTRGLATLLHRILSILG